MRIFGYFLLFSILGIFYAGSLPAQDQTVKGFKTKILAKWNSLLETIKTARWEKRIEWHISADHKHYRLNRVDVIRCAAKWTSGRLWEGETEDFDAGEVTKGTIKLQLINQQYKAELLKGKEVDRWLLTEVNLEEKDKWLQHWRQQYVRCPWLMVGDMPLNQWLAENAFVFTQVEQIADQGNFLLRGHFAYDQGKSSELAQHIKSGYIDFEPKHYYCPMGYQFEINSKVEEGITRGRLEYDATNGIPVLKVSTDEGKVRAKRRKGSDFGNYISGKYITTFSNVKYNAEVGDEEFRLSFYDLPEPKGVTWPSSSKWYLWLIAAALGSLALAIFFARFWRQAGMDMANESGKKFPVQ